ncbi:MAG: methylenetetrahydrofolate--tRNA-(uracil(54)-C(5))-methyltransferase (FADH(2)-oxidizing) TrmFO [Chloroflexi bacterium HGW-Chloroflexi-7]|nr:MAG: methylenetetrahydrofolate--tRNA-(uracil(54)-C(5))-methyltransferase (FADH(2)-oxidizing) TrmFO [Chloroflexi bacterium HGW-Chloroflexi-7]
MEELTVIGGGLAGSEAAWQAAQLGVKVNLYEMRPSKSTDAHVSGNLAELVCSNSLGSSLRNRPSGLLKEECSLLKSLLVACAEESAIPAGDALAVDREIFAQKVTQQIESHPYITIIRQEVTEIPAEPVIIATGPLTSDALVTSIQQVTGARRLYFYDALAPIVNASTIDMSIAFRASRYKYETDPHGDYINCPFTEEQYFVFLNALKDAKRIPLKEFETILNDGVQVNQPAFFEACLPVEVMAARDPLVLTFGPMRPVGLRNPNDAQRPFAVVQLRQDDLADTLYNLVGFQTNLLHSEQARVFRLIPGLEHAEFVRFGQMHRNTYINSPDLLDSTLQCRSRVDLFFAGQIAGIEGYIGNIASGLLAGINAARYVKGQNPVAFPLDTMIGSLHHYIANANPERFQPMKANMGLLPPLEIMRRNKQEKGFIHAKRSLNSLKAFIGSTLNQGSHHEV